MTPLNVLIVEDNLLTANNLQMSMEDAGHKLTGIARNSREALQLVKSDPPDLAIIDISLGAIEEGGIMIAKEILNQHWMPFIYLTGRSNAETIERAAVTQPSAYMFKPFRNEELLIQVKLAYENFVRRPFVEVRPTENDIFYLPLKNGHERVRNEEVLFLKAAGHCTNIYLSNDKNPHMIGTNLGNVVKYFPTPNFVRLSKSLFINMDQLRRIERTHLYLGAENIQVEISEANRKELLKRLKVIRTNK